MISLLNGWGRIDREIKLKINIDNFIKGLKGYEICKSKKLRNPFLIVWRTFYYAINGWWYFTGNVYKWIEK